jgi:hypothetical protein
MSFASFRKFWAVAANRNSSLAPLGPRRRNRSSPRNALETSKQHLDLLSLTTRDGVGLGLGDRASPSYCALIHSYSFWR